MSREAWNVIKNSKRFYVDTYRRAGTILLLSLVLNLFLSIAIHYFYFHQPGRDFYATNGIAPPVQLTALDEANYTSVPLLATTTASATDNKVIPQ